MPRGGDAAGSRRTWGQPEARWKLDDCRGVYTVEESACAEALAAVSPWQGGRGGAGRCGAADDSGGIPPANGTRGGAATDRRTWRRPRPSLHIVAGRGAAAADASATEKSSAAVIPLQGVTRRQRPSASRR